MSTQSKPDYRGELVTFSECPPWKPHPAIGDRRRLPKWSGDGTLIPPPAVGATVDVRVNGLGRSEVVGYFTEHGFLGLEVRPLSPPAWYRKQNGRGATCYVFGAELNN